MSFKYPSLVQIGWWGACMLRSEAGVSVQYFRSKVENFRSVPQMENGTASLETFVNL